MSWAEESWSRKREDRIEDTPAPIGTSCSCCSRSDSFGSLSFSLELEASSIEPRERERVDRSAERSCAVAPEPMEGFGERENRERGELGWNGIEWEESVNNNIKKK